VAQAKSAEGFALERLGRLDEAMASFAQAQDLFAAADPEIWPRASKIFPA